MLGLNVIIAGLALDMANIFAITVVLGLQDKVPEPSVVNTYPIAPPPILTLLTLPKCTGIPVYSDVLPGELALPPVLTHELVTLSYPNI